MFAQHKKQCDNDVHQYMYKLHAKNKKWGRRGFAAWKWTQSSDEHKKKRKFVSHGHCYYP